MTITNNNWNHIRYQEHIIEKLTNSVKGQNDVISLLAYIGYTYSLEVLAMDMGFNKKSLPKLTTLLTGKTGCGKTFLIRKLAEALELPYIKIDMSTVTAEGWVGANVSTAINEFLTKSPRGFGIVHLDEIDKINIGNADRSGKQDLQNQMLELLDGDYSTINDNQEPTQRGKTRDLTNVNNALIICTGSFQMQRDDGNKNKMGFVEQVSLANNTSKTFKEKMREMGFMKELSARIVHSIELQEYTKDDIRDIILNSKDSALFKYNILFGENNTINDSDIEELVDKVHNSDNGIRELESLVFDKYFNKHRRQVNGQ